MGLVQSTHAPRRASTFGRPSLNWMDSTTTAQALDRSLFSVYTCCAVDMLGSAFTIVAMPFYIESFGGGATMVGLVISTWACGNVVSSMWMGAHRAK